MASKGGEARRRARKAAAATATTTTQLKKKKKKIKKMKLEEEEEIEKGSSSTAMAAAALFEDQSASTSDFEECCTPKAERFKIPEIKICPPAPKKQRLISNCSLQRPSPIAFFASPDIELFFFFSSQ